MKYLTIIIILMLSANISFAEKGIKDKKRQVKKHTKIIYQRPDGSIYETYRGAQRWHQVLDGESDDALFEKYATGKDNRKFKKFVYVNNEGETFSTYDMQKFKAERKNNKVLKFRVEETGLSGENIQITALSPNPASGFARVSFLLPEARGASLSVYSVQGMQVLRPAAQDYNRGMNYIDLDLSHLAPGIYYIKLENNREVVTRRLIVVR